MAAPLMIDLLIDRIIERKNPSVVGLDPQLSFVPDFIKDEAFESLGKTPEGAAEALYIFNKHIIDAVYDIVPAVKPQVAMYELFGAAGIACYIKTIEYAHDKGLIVIGDIKRGDIASTAKAYSNAHIGFVDIEGEAHSIFKEDFITVNPYLGRDSIEPFTENCRKFGRGIFVLVKTSNPGSADLQDYKKAGELVKQAGIGLEGKHGYSLVCSVVGATCPEEAAVLRELMPTTFFLVPGYGAQGGGGADIKPCFGDGIKGAIVNSSRGIIAAHQNEIYKGYPERGFAQCARDACIKMRKNIQSVLL